MSMISHSVTCLRQIFMSMIDRIVKLFAGMPMPGLFMGNRRYLIAYDMLVKSDLCYMFAVRGMIIMTIAVATMAAFQNRSGHTFCRVGDFAHRDVQQKHRRLKDVQTDNRFD